MGSVLGWKYKLGTPVNRWHSKAMNSDGMKVGTSGKEKKPRKEKKPKKEKKGSSPPDCSDLTWRRKRNLNLESRFEF